MTYFCFILGQKKLGKVVTPDPWKSGARNTTGMYYNRLYVQSCCVSAEIEHSTLFI